MNFTTGCLDEFDPPIFEFFSTFALLTQDDRDLFAVAKTWPAGTPLKSELHHATIVALTRAMPHVQPSAELQEHLSEKRETLTGTQTYVTCTDRGMYITSADDTRPWVWMPPSFTMQAPMQLTL